VDGYFYREERDFRGIYRILNAQIQEKGAHPVHRRAEELRLDGEGPVAYPGHSSGESLRGSPWVNDFYEFMGDHVFDADLSVLGADARFADGTARRDRRSAADGRQGLRRAAHLFATNGTSTANKVIFQTLLAPGEKLLLDRNCHKSVHHGVVLSGAHPVYLDSALNRKYGLYGPVPKSTLLKGNKENIRTPRP
jgi:arginine decarboxylase